MWRLMTVVGLAALLGAACTQPAEPTPTPFITSSVEAIAAVQEVLASRTVSDTAYRKNVSCLDEVARYTYPFIATQLEDGNWEVKAARVRDPENDPLTWMVSPRGAVAAMNPGGC